MICKFSKHEAQRHRPRLRRYHVTGRPRNLYPRACPAHARRGASRIRSSKYTAIAQSNRQCFTKVIRGGVSVRRNGAGGLDMDRMLSQALSSAEVSFHLLPLRKPANPPTWIGDKQSEWRFQPYWNQKGKGKGKPEKGGKGKGKGKPKAQTFLPKALQGRDNVGIDSHGRRMCYNFNLGKCDKAAAGAQCSNGFHLCCRRDCHAPRAEKDHDQQTSS